MRPGDKPAMGFYGGKYNFEVLTKPTVFYRVTKAGPKEVGAWWMATPPQSESNVRIDKAVRRCSLDQP